MSLVDIKLKYNKLKRLIASETFAYILKRLLQAILTLFLASALCFAVIQLAPGSYLDTLSQNPQISQETIQQLEQQFGLDKSPLEQYLRWLGKIITSGNLAEVSFFSNQWLIYYGSEYPLL